MSRSLNEHEASLIEPPCVRCRHENRAAFEVRVVVVQPCSAVELSAAPCIAAKSAFAATKPRAVSLFPFDEVPPSEAEKPPPGLTSKTRAALAEAPSGAWMMSPP